MQNAQRRQRRSEFESGAWRMLHADELARCVKKAPRGARVAAASKTNVKRATALNAEKKWMGYKEIVNRVRIEHN
jgi:hypothetical protein